jgi:sigma-B regulation protein RsbU (phosphoserine phosphatase)
LARKDAELNFAREVQAALFPAKLPEREDLAFSAICIPAQGISGDFYDVLECEDGRVVFAIADVSGKGISAAILMANAQAVLRTLIKTYSSLSEVCSQMNNHLHQVTESNKFVTFFVAQYLPATQELEYVNAGHQHPILCGVEQGRKLDTGGPPIGMFSGIPYESDKIRLEDGNLIVLYSDGINEARSRDDLEFGDERLSELIASRRNAPLVEIQAAILDSVEEWSGGDPVDDMTIVLVRAEQGGSLGTRHGETS